MLPVIPMLTETVEVAGVSVSFHGLTVAQCQQLQELAETDPEATGPQAIAFAFDVSVSEAVAWIGTVTPAVAVEVSEHVMRASGMAAATGAQFPA